MSDEEKPLDLRDKLAIEILNGLISGDIQFYGMGGTTPRSVAQHIYSYYDSDSVSDKEEAQRQSERLIRTAYMMADVMRKVRLTAFT